MKITIISKNFKQTKKKKKYENFEKKSTKWKTVKKLKIDLFNNVGHEEIFGAD